MANHKWIRIATHLHKCKVCRNLRFETQRFETQWNTIYLDEDHNKRKTAGDCKRKEETMKLLDIIAQAREKGIMPILKEGVFLEIKNHLIYMVNSKKSKRKLFDLSDGIVMLAGFVRSAKNNKSIQDSSSYWKPFIEIGEVTIEVQRYIRHGEALEPFVWETTYINDKGEEVSFKESRTRVVPRYKTSIVEEKVNRILFEKDDE